MGRQNTVCTPEYFSGTDDYQASNPWLGNTVEGMFSNDSLESI